MIEYIKGKITNLTPAEAIIETTGIGYLLFISLNTYSALQGKEEGVLHVHEDIREDAHNLFGFYSTFERDLFRLLIGISGVGGQTARMILSAFTPKDLVGIIQNEDIRSLKSVKGIGPKAAQRIIVELKDKVMKFERQSPSATRQTNISADIEEAIGALQTLGFPPAPAKKVVLEITKQNPSITIEGIIKLALKML
ncbi:Holliday junction DNA helicase RuvA [Alloprevotella rava F0323]|uniref:Holliday junction branch migration complex subunit RuvA n=1 Tax=Alloprevotella rava F0323 TaxID=679199 RepID=G5G8V3_9BACT|nr:Holliday junction branch migration protein RuvA [Alloprevotella rava]EHG25095.1 Holliday junction DNA helicase RuvA [Alloprevotella rava F0323]